MSDTFRDRHSTKNAWIEQNAFRGYVPSAGKRQVRRQFRADIRNAMQRGDYDSASVSETRKSAVTHNIFVLNW